MVTHPRAAFVLTALLSCSGALSQPEGAPATLSLRLARPMPQEGVSNVPVSLAPVAFVTAPGASSFTVEFFVQARLDGDASATGLTTFSGELRDDQSGTFAAGQLLNYEENPTLPYFEGITDAPTPRTGMFPDYRATIGNNNADEANGLVFGGPGEPDPRFEFLPLNISVSGAGAVGVWKNIYKVTWTTTDMTPRALTLDLDSAGGGYRGPGLVTTTDITADAYPVTISASTCPCEWDGEPGVGIFDLVFFFGDWLAQTPASDLTGTDGHDVLDVIRYLDCFYEATSGPC